MADRGHSAAALPAEQYLEKFHAGHACVSAPASCVMIKLARVRVPMFAGESPSERT